MTDEAREIVRLSVADGSEAVITRGELLHVFHDHFPDTVEQQLADFEAGKMVPLCLARYFWREKEAA